MSCSQLDYVSLQSHSASQPFFGRPFSVALPLTLVAGTPPSRGLVGPERTGVGRRGPGVAA